MEFTKEQLKARKYIIEKYKHNLPEPCTVHIVGPVSIYLEEN